MMTTPDSRNPSHIPIPSRFLRVRLKSHSSLQSDETPSQILQTSQHDSQMAGTSIPSYVTRPRLGVRAWEKNKEENDHKRPLSIDIGRFSTARNTQTNGEKKVTFSTKIPLYKYSTSPVRKISALESAEMTCYDDTDADDSLILSYRNGFNNSATRSQVLRAVSTLEQALRAMEEKYDQLNRDHEQIIHEMTERQTQELSRERETLQNQIKTLGEIHSKDSKAAQRTVKGLEEKLATKTAECSNLQAELDARKDEIQSKQGLEKSKTTLLHAQIESLQGTLIAREAEIKELQNHLDAETTLKLQSEISANEERQRLMADLSTVRKEKALLEQRLSMVHAEHSKEQATEHLKHSQKEVEYLHKELKEEKDKNTELLRRVDDAESKLKHFETSIVESTSVPKKDVIDASTEMVMAEGDGNNELAELKTRTTMLRVDLKAAQDIRDSLEKKLLLLEQSTEQKSKKLNELETELEQKTADLAERESQVTKLKKTLTNFIDKSSLQAFEAKVKEMDVELCEAKLNLKSATKQLKNELEISEQLKEQLKCSQRECEVLQEQLQLQKESTTFCLDQLYQTSLFKQKKLIKIIKNLHNKLEEAEASEGNHTQLEEQIAELRNQLEIEKEKYKKLHDELTEKMVHLSHAEEQFTQLTVSFKKNKECEERLQSELSQLKEAHDECRTHLLEVKSKMEASEVEKEELKLKLAETQSTVDEEQTRSSMQEALLTQTKNQLEALKRTKDVGEQQTKEHIETLKAEHQKQIKAATLQLKQFETTIESLRQREEMVKDNLEKARESQHIQQQELEAKLVESEGKLAEKRQKVDSLNHQNSSLRMKLKDLQSKVGQLTEAQRQYEEYTRKSEEMKRMEMQQFFEEMAQHIQQQSDSHKYLDKLRVENEKIALEDKDRQIQELREEVRILEHHRFQAEGLMKSIKFENQVMRTRLRESSSRVESVSTIDDRAAGKQDKLPPINSNFTKHTNRHIL